MSEKIKPELDCDSITKFLNTIFDSPIQNMEGINNGQIAQTISFNTNNKEYVVQFNNANMSQGNNFEIAFHDLLRKNNVPMRSVVSKGCFGEMGYLITEKLDAIGFNQLIESEYLEVLPQVIKTLLNLYCVNIDNYSGYGYLNEKMDGWFSSWEEHLIFIEKEEPGLFYGEWHELFINSFLDKKLYYNYFEKMKNNFKEIPSIRKLVHGGYGYGNVLVKDKKVQAILDWQDARYGDPLFDLAYLVFWNDKEIEESTINEYKYQANINNIKLINFEERLKCYKYYIGLDGMRFSARLQNKKFYDAVLDKLNTI